ncbi:hypothetical protein PANT111_130283 [Pantoea brenneri]|uniref:Uncharacterized protein n=1 Tax=Pantoea brenneri TaxID=472694 RepID=A0AAX3J2H0_9GAMM|nr:hypothetical protein PANT111_130283 [Pantoea brenneri]
MAKTAIKFTFAFQTVKISACYIAQNLKPAGQGVPGWGFYARIFHVRSFCTADYRFAFTGLWCRSSGV